MPRGRAQAASAAPSPLGAPKPAKGAAKRQRARKRAQRRDREYLHWVHGQRCLVRGCNCPAEAHHERALGDGDAFAVPLCAAHHRTGKNARHVIRSLAGFEQRHGLDLAAEITRLRALYEKEYPTNAY